MLDSIFYKYQLGLADFHIDTYSSHPAKVLIFIYFILATIFTNIMFLNMIIAIMEQTYERVPFLRYKCNSLNKEVIY